MSSASETSFRGPEESHMDRYNDGTAGTTAVPSATSLHDQSVPGGVSVDVNAAKAEFQQLERHLSRQKSSPVSESADVEKGEYGDVQGPFDLREYLTSANDANARAGIKHKHVGVTWDDLEVEVAGGVDSKVYVRTFAMACLEFCIYPFLYVWGLALKIFPIKRNIPKRSILHKSSGRLKPGEMCLVLGIPGSGCTTFLKAIANQRDEFAAVNGEVLYAGISAEEMSRHYRGEVVFNGEDDIHIPTLTVAQTMNFALSTKTPAKRPGGIDKKEFNATILNSLLRMLNISHTKDTLVGDAFVRGVSGGEKKRVSIAEMMTTRARVQCWDGTTRGLDAATALDFTKSLRIMTDVLGQTTFVSLYQAGDQIFRLFDKVIILDKGRQVYFGSPDEAQTVLCQSGLQGSTSSKYRRLRCGMQQFASGRSESNVVHGPEALEASFRSSEKYKALMDETHAYTASFATEKEDQDAFRQSVLDDKRKGVSKTSPYTLGYIGQVKALTVRQFQLRLQDSFSLWTSYFTSTLLAIVIGSTFYNLPPNSNGAFTRGSLIFIAMLTSALEAFGELAGGMLGRPILNKQTGFSFYRPSAIAWANLFADLPFTAIRVFIYDVIVFFMAHLSRSAGSFWTFHFYNYFAFVAMQAVFRLLGLLCSNFDSAFRVAAFFIPNMITFAGYIVPVQKIKRWLFWIYYINPISYAFGALMENEFSRVDLTCDGNYVVPRNIPGAGLTQYPNTLGLNQACTLFGSEAGSDIVKGSSYISVGFHLDVADLWRRNLPVLVAFFVFFSLLQVIVLEYFPIRTGGSQINIFAKPRLIGKKRATDSIEEKEKDANQKKNLVLSSKVFIWEHLDYVVPVPGGERRLLTDVFGYVKPGTLTALMGASGAGKTTCLDVLALRKNIGVVSGDILLDGRPLAADFARGTAYAEQMDVHEPTATVREALRFSAYLRQPYSVPQEEKDEYVEEILTLLELESLSDALILSLNTEARKRLTIGVELASKPQLLLFLDEPTSGLDGQSAWNLVRFLRKLADSGQAILCTIHQPSALLFESFDRLLLLESGGRTVYHGPIGEDSIALRDYFARNGASCPPDANPAEYMLEAIGAGTTPRVGPKDWFDVWVESPENEKLLREIEDLKQKGLQKQDSDSVDVSTYATPFLYQLRTVSNRALLALWRSPDYVFTRLFVHVFISLFVSLSLLQLGHSVRDLQYRVFGIFWTTVMPIIVMSQIEPAFILNRLIFIREASSRIYSPYVFAIGQLISEIPYSILCAFAYWVLFVWPMGFGKGAEGTNGNGFQFLVILFIELFGVSLGQVIGALAPSIRASFARLQHCSSRTSLTVNDTGCRTFQPILGSSPYHILWSDHTIPSTGKVLEVVALPTHSLSMLSTELKGLEIRCNPDEFAVFNPPSGQTCQQWAGAFVSVAGGYLDNGSDSNACRYCQFRVGDEFFTPLNIEFSNRWRDAFLILAYFAFNIAVTIVASRFLRYARR